MMELIRFYKCGVIVCRLMDVMVFSFQMETKGKKVIKINRLSLSFISGVTPTDMSVKIDTMFPDTFIHCATIVNVDIYSY